MNQPVSPVAAAAANLRPLALSVRNEDELSGTAATTPAPDRSMITIPQQQVGETVGKQLPASVSGANQTYAAPDAPAPIAAQAATAASGIAPSPSAFQAELPSPVARMAPRASSRLAAPAGSAAPATRIAMAYIAPSSEVRHVATVKSAVAGLNGPSVQFTAAPTEDAARGFWRSLVHRFPDTLGAHQAIVVRLDKGGQVFWRLRTESLGTAEDAQLLCSKVRAGGQDCFVARS